MTRFGRFFGRPGTGDATELSDIRENQGLSISEEDLETLKKTCCFFGETNSQDIPAIMGVRSPEEILVYWKGEVFFIRKENGKFLKNPLEKGKDRIEADNGDITVQKENGEIVELQSPDRYNALLGTTGNKKVFTVAGFFGVGEDIGVKGSLNLLAI